MGHTNQHHTPNAIGLATEKFALIVAEKRKIKSRIGQFMTPLSRGVGCAINGSLPQSDFLIMPTVSAARNFYLTYNEEPMFQNLAEEMHDFETLPRPEPHNIGYNLMAICCDSVEGPKLWKMENSGSYQPVSSATVGTHAEELMLSIMGIHFELLDLEDAINILLNAVQSTRDERLPYRNMEIGFVTIGNPLFQHIKGKEVQVYLKKALKGRKFPKRAKVEKNEVTHNSDCKINASKVEDDTVAFSK